MIRKFKTWMLKWLLKWQSCPTSKDLENKELKELAERLKGNSEKETLTNILEWQDRNVQFWLERWPFAPLLICVFVIFVGAFLYRLFTILCGCLGIFIFALIYLSIRYWGSLKEKSMKGKICKFIILLYDTIRLSLPVEKIVKKYRRAVCRDYAKLTAALLFSIYPNSKVYFFAIPRHFAAAIKIDDEYYVLDQILPVLTKNGWLNKWNLKDAEVYASELIRNSEGKVTIRWCKRITRNSPKIDTEKLTEEITNILGIKQSPQRNEPFEIRLYDYAIYYDDNEITKYSLIRAIKNKLESELCSNIDKVSRIEISQNEKDLIMKVYFNSGEPISRPSTAS